jgi:hypothetical protein
MTQIDPEQERKRLTEVYGQQTDEELAAVAHEEHELTDVAREALRAELAKRGLYSGQLEEISSLGEDSAEFRDLVTIRSFWSLPEAQLASGLLGTAGIDSFLFDENMVRVSLVNVVGGVKLRVDAQNADEANRILDEKGSGLAAPEDAASDEPDLPVEDRST